MEKQKTIVSVQIMNNQADRTSFFRLLASGCDYGIDIYPKILDFHLQPIEQEAFLFELELEQDAVIEYDDG